MRKPDGRSTVAAFDHTNDATLWHKRFHAQPIPAGRPTSTSGSTAGRISSSRLLFIDWLTANPAVQADYLALKRRVAAQGHADTGAYAEAKEPWFLDAYRRAWEWADATGWRPTSRQFGGHSMTRAGRSGRRSTGRGVRRAFGAAASGAHRSIQRWLRSSDLP